MDNGPKEMDNTPILMTPPSLRKKTSKTAGTTEFPGQRLVVVHPPQIVHAARLALLRPFRPTDIGLFRSAVRHERSRPAGCPQAIFIHCVGGRGWCELGGARHPVGPNDLLVIPARCPHAYGADETDPWTIEWFHAAGIGVAELLRRMGAGRRSPVLPLRPGAWDSALFEEALSGLETRFTHSHLLGSALALSHLLARVIIRQKEGVVDASSPAARLEKVAAFLRANHALSTGVHEMASMAGFSPSHFTALFLKHTGHPPTDYLIRTRVNRACQLLDFTSLNIKEIAASVGYSDPYYFSRVFKKMTACSPKAYRARLKG